MNALLALVKKDLILYFSNRRALLVTVAAPIAIAAFFGSLFGNSKDAERARVPIAMIDLDQSATSRKIVAAMTADATFDVQPRGATDAVAAVRRGKLRAVVTLPAHFGEQARRALFSAREKPMIDITFDPSQAITLQVVRGLLAQHVMEAVTQSAFSSNGGASDITSGAREDVARNTTLTDTSRKDLIALFDAIDRVRNAPPPAAGSAAATRGPSFRIPYAVKETEAKSGSDLKYNAYSHAFAGMGVQFILFMGIDLGIKLLTMRRMGLWQRMRAAPLSRAFLLGSQVTSGAIIAAILFALIFAAGTLVFGVRIEGSFIGFVGLIIAFAIMTASFGLFIAALGRTPEATRGLAIFVTLVMVMLGGAWVPAFVFPQWLQTVSLAVPTRWAIDGFDAVTWRGLGLDAAWQSIVVLLGFSLLFAVVAAWRFDWDEN
ncbi:MAG: ABC transporter permease [Burkholderiaceae bacterium]